MSYGKREPIRRDWYEFLIPMRGNEMSTTLSTPAGSIIPNPHEG